MQKLPSFLAVVAAVACSDSFQPTVNNVIGDYTVRSFVTTDSTGTTEWLRSGGTFQISLKPNGTTSGLLFVPSAGPGGTDFDADMAGTWTLTGDTIEFTQSADSFVRDVAWIATKDRLTTDHVFGGTRIQVVLTK